MTLKELINTIKSCTVCSEHLPLGANPILRASKSSRVAIIGQAPGTKVHASGIPWDDQSGKTLRSWMGVSTEQFYDEKLFAIVSMGFCYPGKGKSGDLPPRHECAPLWHHQVFSKTPHLEMRLLIGQYAQRYYLGPCVKSNLTETVRAYHEYLPDFVVLPHPSPRNRFWLIKNPWFEIDVLPILRQRLSLLMG